MPLLSVDRVAELSESIDDSPSAGEVPGDVRFFSRPNGEQFSDEKDYWTTLMTRFVTRGTKRKKK